MDTVAVGPVGMRVSGLSLVGIDPGTVASLQALLAEHGVLVLPDQDIDDATFVAFLRAFGQLTFSTGETPVPGCADLNLISNVGRAVPPKSTFHVDTSYVSRPPAYTALRAVQIPRSGGQTLFSNQYRAYDTLPDEVKDRLHGRSITHVVTGLDLGPDDETSAEHPIFREHPVSGRTSLYLTTAARCRSISGMGEDETRETVQYLLEHSTREENLYRHAWSPGDVVMWDNGCVLHRADHEGVVGDRVMHRGMVADYPQRTAA
ncbi:TauD/TfdA family dioxygenase [Allobranchiibius sp. GilTou73]|uniref:TauD/TfdA dioxygenase family protein n=1 Tax=Allobranchiibius sp. GilTou73 TaxID=2904523 RepID=UPI001F2778A0|nr:TauD/TfdA family dioxygenase [Allobranchiibius sp. GilTou73]UIJ36136.1 TauD/TfdA family dioxygenase [Allobranchiibius sp. GilTou73]